MEKEKAIKIFKKIIFYTFVFILVFFLKIRLLKSFDWWSFLLGMLIVLFGWDIQDILDKKMKGGNKNEFKRKSTE